MCGVKPDTVISPTCAGFEVRRERRQTQPRKARSGTPVQRSGEGLDIPIGSNPDDHGGIARWPSSDPNGMAAAQSGCGFEHHLAGTLLSFIEKSCCILEDSLWDAVRLV